MTGQSNSEGGWPGGWLVAVVAGVIAALLARWLGDVGMAAAVLVGIFVFLVFGVLLGMFWAAPAAGGDHGDHGHDPAQQDHGQDSHAATAAPVVLAPVVEPVAEPVFAPVVVAPVPEPVVRAAVPAAMMAGEARPVGLTAPRGGKGDDLQALEGIGPVMEKLCHELGIFHFDQIAAWGAGEVAWMDANLKGFKGRVTRDRWVRQAGLIAEVGLDEFRRRAKTNDY